MIKFVYGTIFVATLVAVMTREGQTPPLPAAPTATVQSLSVMPEPKPVMGNGYAQTVLDRAPDGHFYAELTVNGTPITFLVDTGASIIALSRADAQRLGLSALDSDFTGVARTASGTVGTKSVMLDRVALGALEARQVEGAIVQSGLDQSLLGQNWLQRVGTVTIEGDRMILR